ncbi:hypothetical protein [Xanthomonas arboricola]|uniref:hypothetical protein n=1 Tax=Xanthomonas arboricola TaxID=56448 RepID=UPI000C832BA7|nr:hypothetical protein [Xanthomonas arboricola]SOU07168.1 hypothetical protein LMG19144_02220 [Xanthomonas arboricola pv. fragariae]
MKVEILTGARKTAPNVRLVEPLTTEAATKAKTLGISLNALVSIAVRQYLDGEKLHQSAKQHDLVPHLIESQLGRRDRMQLQRWPGAASPCPGAAPASVKWAIALGSSLPLTVLSSSRLVFLASP